MNRSIYVLQFGALIGVRTVVMPMSRSGFQSPPDEEIRANSLLWNTGALSQVKWAILTIAHHVLLFTMRLWLNLTLRYVEVPAANE